MSVHPSEGENIKWRWKGDPNHRDHSARNGDRICRVERDFLFSVQVNAAAAEVASSPAATRALFGNHIRNLICRRLGNACKIPELQFPKVPVRLKYRHICIDDWLMHWLAMENNGLGLVQAPHRT